ncbi:MAG TPA: amidase family protein [Candidatus Acidoferrales bacterium]|nr:amidase family protein [Candidatus Acidoferrales bacterium]
MSFAAYSHFDGLGLAELVQKGDVSPVELVEAAIGRIENHNPKLNAVIYKMYERGREAAAALAQHRGARRPFHGVPFLLKDILGNYEGVPTAAGCRFMTGIVATRDDTLVARYKAAGLVPLGKTNAPECGILPTTESALYGPCRNPWNLGHSTGGSSGGSAAAVAAGIVPLAHANDGGGSIRIPASCCGLVGLKPTRARNPLGPDVGDMMSGLVVEHVVSRTVRDCAAALDCTHGPEPGDPYWAPPVARPFLEEIRTPPARLRIAFSTKTFSGAPLHRDCVAATEATAKLCADLGHIVEEGAPPVDMGVFMSAFLSVFSAATPTMIDAFAMLHGRTPTEKDFEGLTWGIYEMGKQVSASQYQIAIALIQIAARHIARWHQTYDCWLTTTLGAPPIAIGTIDIHERDPMKGMQQLADYVPVTPIQNATGQPSISLPLYWNAAGLPIGLMFTGRFGDEATLLRLAAQLEQAQPWKDRRPPIYG